MNTKPLHACATAMLLVVGLLVTVRPAGARAAAAGPAACAPQGDLHFVCNLIGVEDFLPVSGGRWLVGSSYVEKSVGLYLIDPRTKSGKPVALSLAASPDPLYAGCAAPDLKNLQTHGLDVRTVNGHITVFAINHGGRESVEIFHLHPAAGTAEWVGCALPPEGVTGNSISAMAHGAFVMTKFMDSRDREGFAHILAGQVTGTVYRWTPGKGFSEVPGTQFSGDNGILTSADGRWVYVNAYGTHEIYRVPLSGQEKSDQGKPAVAKVDFSPDNLRWAPDGSILATGQFITPQTLNGLHGWATVRLDPKTMATTPVVREAGLKDFDNATSAVQVGRMLWFGTFRGDRMAYMPLPGP
ncbi:MAG TPA: SMP-30/gluconolactonase/LRE family protein [Steroidobacteraceae bacterium]|nr:SMP-30/gluconolactonase/LRE family protein [Steroidobacteraceae bacterium]